MLGITKTELLCIGFAISYLVTMALLGWHTGAHPFTFRF